MKSKCYSELMLLPDYTERVKYLSIQSNVSVATFGGHREINQVFYRSKEWKDLKKTIIIRDNGCDLAIPGREIFGKVFVHHINPITVDDVLSRAYKLLDPENLITVSFDTHQLIHYVREIKDREEYIERKPDDTKLW